MAKTDLHTAETIGEGMAPPRAADAPAEMPPAWEQVAQGRYMPRRVRGSCLGRELG